MVALRILEVLGASGYVLVCTVLDSLETSALLGRTFKEFLGGV